MISKGLSILADVMAVISLWLKSESLPLWVKILLTLACLLLAIIIIIFEKGGSELKVVDFYYDTKEHKLKCVFIPKTPVMKADSLVGLYKEKQLSAIGYLIDNDDGTDQYQVEIVYVINNSICEICSSKNNYKSYSVKPTMLYSKMKNLFSNDMATNKEGC